MGKNLIIKGADFSENAINNKITWYTDVSQLIDVTSEGGYTGVQRKIATYRGYGTRPSQSNGLLNVPINLIKVYIPTGTTTEITSERDLEVGDTYAVYHIQTDGTKGISYDLLTEFQLTQQMLYNKYLIIELPQQVTLLNQNEFISIGKEESEFHDDNTTESVPLAYKSK